MKIMTWNVEPIGKVRMSQRDKWAKRPVVVRYRAYHDDLRRLGVTLEPGDEIRFYIAMPNSWSAKKRAQYADDAHRQKPDLDNLIGGLMDAVLPEDKALWWLGQTSKRWTAGQSRIVVIRG